MAHPNSPVRGPVFIPKYTHIDNEFAGLNVEAALVAANFVASTKYHVDALARDACNTLLIDPQTNYLTYPGYLDKPTYRAIPYAPAEPIQARDMLRDERRRTEFVQAVLDFQRSNGAGVLIAPYFYARDLDDIRYLANVRLVAKAKELIDEDEVLYAPINISGGVLASPRLTDEIAQDYEGPGAHGFLLSFENVDDRSASYDVLSGLASLTRRLAQGRDVFPYPIAAFGQVLTALGANGFVSGIGWLEVFRESNLLADRVGFAGDRIPRSRLYYVPELFSYLNPNDAETIFDDSETMQEYRCRCPECERGIHELTEVAAKKRHFLNRRHQEVEDLAHAENGITHIRGRLELALELANVIEQEALVRIPSEHLVRWLQVLEFAASTPMGGEPPLDERELDRMIHEGRREGGNAPDRPRH